MFGFIKEKIKKVYTAVTQQISSLFSRSKLDEQFLKELSDLLISADAGVATTDAIIKELSAGIKGLTITTMEQAKELLEKLLVQQLIAPQQEQLAPTITLLVGINGSGKTTFVAKFANMLKHSGKKVLVVAGDTFRAAATEQLLSWAERIGVEVFVGKDEQDPASVIFDACTKFKNEHFDYLIIDTAGRLQTKVNLMRELEKIRKIVDKQLPNCTIGTWLTIDTMIGQNSLQQADLFHQATSLSGLVLTKLDGTGKGGVVFAITRKLGVPIIYVTFGETLEDVKQFDPTSYVHDLLYE